MTEKRFKKEDCPRFIPFEKSYSLFNIVDAEKLDYAGFNLTVESARDVLNELVELGYGDFELLIGYDSNLVYTGFTDDIIVDENRKKVLVME